MPKRGNPVQVATTRRHYKGKVYETHLLRRSYREGGKVKNETLGNLSHRPRPVKWCKDDHHVIHRLQFRHHLLLLGGGHLSHLQRLGAEIATGHQPLVVLLC